MSMFNDYFMMKYNFYDEIPIYSKLNFISIINDACLVEDVKTKNRKWVMRYDIYPLCDKSRLDACGDWSYCEHFNEIAKKHNLI